MADFDAMFGDDSDEDDDVVGKIVSHPKVLISRVKEMKEIGGSRGLFATTDCNPGFLVLSEIPTFDWTQIGNGDFNKHDTQHLYEVLRNLCQDEKALAITHSLYPNTIADADSVEIADVKQKLTEEQINTIRTEAGIEEPEIIRLVLVLRHNGFSSGLYKELSLINHSCDPNCIKFAPKAGSLGASEIWTTRHINKGEEFTICYCAPLEMTQHSMREYLREQHRFDCRCSMCIRMVYSRDAVDGANDNLKGKENSEENKHTDAAMAEESSSIDSQLITSQPDSNSHRKPNPPSQSAGYAETTFPLLDQLVRGLLSHIDIEKFIDTNSAAMHYSTNSEDDFDQLQEELEKMETELQWRTVEEPLYCLKTYLTMIIASEVLLVREHARIKNWKKASTEEAKGNSADPQASISLLRLITRLLKVTVNAGAAVIEAYDTQRRAKGDKKSKDHIKDKDMDKDKDKMKNALINTEIAAYATLAELFCTLTEDHSLLLFAVETFITYSWFLREFQVLSLGSHHPDLAASAFDLAQSMKILPTLFPTQCNEVIEKLRTQFRLFSSQGSQGARNTEHNTATRQVLLRTIEDEAKRVRGLYSTMRNHPDVVPALQSRKPGSVYWGAL